jgi:hypothetical protein
MQESIRHTFHIIILKAIHFYSLLHAYSELFIRGGFVSEVRVEPISPLHDIGESGNILRRFSDV